MTVHVYSPEDTRQYLQSLLERGRLQSQYEEYFAYCVDNRPSNYSQEAFKAQFRQKHEKNRRSDYASLIETVARGMLAFQLVDLAGKYVKLIDIKRVTPFPDHYRDMPFPYHYKFNKGKRVVLINPFPDALNFDIGQRLRESAEILAPWGELGIKAIVLSCDESNINATQLGVVLPANSYMPRLNLDYIDYELQSCGFKVATFELDGSTNARTFIPDNPDPDYWKKMLGLMDGPLPGNVVRTSSSDFNASVGFPGATEYLADKLPALEGYFSGLAALIESHSRR